jgi:hypothetical protein
VAKPPASAQKPARAALQFRKHSLLADLTQVIGARAKVALPHSAAFGLHCGRHWTDLLHTGGKVATGGRDKAVLGQLCDARNYATDRLDAANMRGYKTCARQLDAKPTRLLLRRHEFCSVLEGAKATANITKRQQAPVEPHVAP